MDYNNLPDRELLSLCAQGNTEAWDFFVEHYSRLLYNAIHTTMRKYVSDYLREDVEDIFSQIFESLLNDNCRRMKQFRGERNSSVATWLRVIAVNRTINHITRTRTHISLDDESERAQSIRTGIKSDQPSVPEQLSNAQEQQILKMIVEKLKPQEQLILHYHLEGLSSKEISRIVSKTQNAIDSQLSRTRKKLNEILDSYKISP